MVVVVSRVVGVVGCTVVAAPTIVGLISCMRRVLLLLLELLCLWRERPLLLVSRVRCRRCSCILGCGIMCCHHRCHCCRRHSLRCCSCGCTIIVISSSSSRSSSVCSWLAGAASSQHDGHRGGLCGTMASR